MTPVHDFLAGHRDQFVAELASWVRLPSVAGVAEHDIDLLRSANWLVAALRDTGFPVAEVWRTTRFALYQTIRMGGVVGPRL